MCFEKTIDLAAVGEQRGRKISQDMSPAIQVGGDAGLDGVMDGDKDMS